MRPTYETEGDKNREAKVIDSLCAVWECNATKLPKFYKQDWALTSVGGTVRALVEVKCRTHPRERYPTLILSLEKWLALAMLSEHTNAKGILAVQFSDGIFWMVAKPQPQWRIAIGGRTDRNDPDDVEPVVHIPTNSLKPLLSNGHPTI